MMEITGPAMIFATQLVKQIREHRDAFNKCGDNHDEPIMLGITDTGPVPSIREINLTYKIVTNRSKVLDENMATTEFLITIDGGDDSLVVLVSCAVVKELMNAGYNISIVSRDNHHRINGVYSFSLLQL